MCDSLRYVHNKFIHKSVLVSCGRCKACQQEKANARAMRIRNHNDGKLCLFLMLSYENRFVPYVYANDIVNIDPSECRDIPVYRDCSVRWYKDNKIVKDDFSIITSFKSNEFQPFEYNAPHLTKKFGCVGVIYWRDVQNFIKRLRINLNRFYGYDTHISYYATGEYGESTHRPHFHLLVYFEEGSLQTLRPIIAKSWPYGDMLKSDKRIQVAIDPSGYVASYITKSDGLPKILESSPIRQKHSHSLYFGHNLSCFSLPSLLEKADSLDMCYRKEIIKDGVSLLADVPIPKYIIARFFPKFKGYSSFSPVEIYELLRFPQKLWSRLGDHCRLTVYGSDLKPLGFNDVPSELICRDLLYSREQFRAFQIHLMHCYGCYYEITGKSIYDYAIDYEKVWKARFCYIFRHSFDYIRDITDFGFHYENANEFVNDPSIAPTLPDPSYMYYEQNPMKRQDYLIKHSNLVDLFNKKQNIRIINNIAMTSIDEEF